MPQAISRIDASPVFVLAASMAPPLAVVAPLGLAPLFAIAAVAALAMFAIAGHWPAMSRGFVWVIAAFIAWSGVTAIWAIDPMLALRGWLPITATAAGGVILLGAAAALNPQQRNRIGVVLLYGFLAALCLLFLEAASALAAERSIAERILGREIPWAYFNRATTAMALLAWPAAIVLARRRGIYWAAGLLLASFLIFTRFGSRAALLGMLVGGVVFALAFWRPRAATLAPAVLVALVVTAPLLPRLPVLENLSERRDINVSIYQRAAIWQFAAAKIAERPVLGWGLNASRIIPGGREKIGEMAELMPLHPHNAPLQWWLELGGVGALLGAALLAFAIRAIAAMDPSPLGPAAGAGLFTASFVISSISYGIWQGWWMAALWLAAVFMAIVAESRRPAEEPKSSVP